MNIFIYFIIALSATTIGSMSGLGGGVIIKPLLDVLGHYDLSIINILSSMTVMTMSVVSIIKQVKYGFKLEIRKTVLLGFGSIVGGLIGEKLLSLLIFKMTSNRAVILQNLILAIILILILYYMKNKQKFKRHKIKNTVLCVSIGVFMGTISSFLSIGGGPINVCILSLFFSMETKDAAVNSIITILFSQGSKLMSIFLKVGVSSFKIELLPFMMIGGILGGIIGSKLNKKLNSTIIDNVFNLVVIALILLNCYNVISKLI